MIPLFDAHCDTASRMVKTGCGLWQNDGHVDLERAVKYRPYAQVFALFGGDLDCQLQKLTAELEQNRGSTVLCRTAAEAKSAAETGRAAAFLSVEGAELLDCSEAGLRRAYALGVRSVGLTWNHENALCGSCVEAPDKGLTQAGRRFVRLCRELGVLVDLSHLSDPGFWDVCEMGGPILASHSNARTLCAHPRNLTDAMFRAVAESGGVVGINLYARFLGDSPTEDTVAAHMEHFLALGGEKHVALGCDLDGCDRLPDGMQGIQDIERLYETLLRRNFREDLVRDIFYNNMMGLVSKVCDT